MSRFKVRQIVEKETNLDDIYCKTRRKQRSSRDIGYL
jgi:hypothetical protein